MAGRRSRGNEAAGGFPDGGGGGVVATALRCRCPLAGVTGKSALSSTEAPSMRSHRKELWFETKTRRAYLNVTGQIEAEVRASGVREGLCLVNAMHITASVYIND